ncbi:MAG: fumarylacetoacetate hydrolase family protein, partial [Actinomycetota bacterium]|nr:fumarylacetoacetate hydrolase family protein [Actinomycetota bacterium]
TGTPPGVGAGMKPPRFLVDGDVLVTEIEGIGRLTQRLGAGQPSGKPGSENRSGDGK